MRESMLNPIRIYFGTSHNDITKKRTTDAKTVKKMVMERNNQLAQVAKNTKQFKKDNPEIKEEK